MAIEGMKRLVERVHLACGSVGYRVVLGSHRGTAEAALSTPLARSLCFFSSRLWLPSPAPRIIHARIVDN